MTKDSRGQSVSADQGRSSRKLSCNSNRVKRASSKVTPKDEEDVKEWEEARCPVCMEHPHNAVLLICSSHEKGCRPYTCDTSYRHSNCLDQFRKSCAASAKETEDVPLQVDHGSVEAIPDSTVIAVAEQVSPDTSTPSPSNNKAQAKLPCPLCRGHIKEWVVMESARRFMNSKSRSCACETCEYSGSYADLRKHARVEHPLVRPSETDPERRRNWRRMERQRDMGDLLSTLQSSFWEDSDEEGDGNGASPSGDRSFLRAFLALIRVFRPASGSRSSRSWSGTSTYTYRTRAHVTIRSRSVMLLGEGFNGDSLGSSTIEGESESTNDGTAAPP
ncbi:hypothetical protein MLD38_015315 [Melastoma candidum]|uniref:Uncharacterized protein n=1 Tax=Melastoma candidum TaxID=119954 RepID=A0ACB9RGB0_9MYRT|nr:hypothetical protein MLD38_015315 [Melastoma candidum]